MDRALCRFLLTISTAPFWLPPSSSTLSSALKTARSLTSASQRPRAHRINLSTSVPSDTETCVLKTATTSVPASAASALASLHFRERRASTSEGSKLQARRWSLAEGQLLCNPPSFHRDPKQAARGRERGGRGKKFQRARVYLNVQVKNHNYQYAAPPPLLCSVSMMQRLQIKCCAGHQQPRTAKYTLSATSCAGLTPSSLTSAGESQAKSALKCGYT